MTPEEMEKEIESLKDQIALFDKQLTNAYDLIIRHIHKHTEMIVNQGSSISVIIASVELHNAILEKLVKDQEK